MLRSPPYIHLPIAYIPTPKPFSSLPHPFNVCVLYHLQRNTPIQRILQKNAPINLPLIQIPLLIPIIHHIARPSRFLQQTELILSAPCDIDRPIRDHGLELRGAEGVVDADLAISIISSRTSVGWGMWEDVLLVVIQLNRKVLPLRIVDSNAIQRIPITIQDLEVILVGIAPPDDAAGLELKLREVKVQSQRPSHKHSIYSVPT